MPDFQGPDTSYSTLVQPQHFIEMSGNSQIGCKINMKSPNGPDAAHVQLLMVRLEAILRELDREHLTVAAARDVASAIGKLQGLCDNKPVHSSGPLRSTA